MNRRGSRAILGVLLGAVLAAVLSAASCSPPGSSTQAPPLFDPKTECPNLERIGVLQPPYTADQINTILNTLGTTADTTDPQLNADIETAYHTANSLKRLMDANQHSYGGLPAQLYDQLGKLSNDCSRDVGG